MDEIETLLRSDLRVLSWSVYPVSRRVQCGLLDRDLAVAIDNSKVRLIGKYESGVRVVIYNVPAEYEIMLSSYYPEITVDKFIEIVKYIETKSKWKIIAMNAFCNWVLPAAFLGLNYLFYRYLGKHNFDK